jgi:hypothetical protein
MVLGRRKSAPEATLVWRAAAVILEEGSYHGVVDIEACAGGKILGKLRVETLNLSGDHASPVAVGAVGEVAAHKHVVHYDAPSQGPRNGFVEAIHRLVRLSAVGSDAVELLRGAVSVPSVGVSHPRAQVASMDHLSPPVLIETGEDLSVRGVPQTVEGVRLVVKAYGKNRVAPQAAERRP